MKVLPILNTIRKNRKGEDTLPRMLTYIITFRCNARCIMCDSWKKAKGKELTLDEIEQVFRKLPPLDILRLSGGEPFLRKDLPEIVELGYRHLKPSLIHITSNGLLDERIEKFCHDRNRKTGLYLLFSLDGMEEKHNKVRGVKAWEKTVPLLKRLAPLRKKLNLSLGVNFTVVDEEGLEDFKTLSAYLKPYNIKLNCVFAYDVSATYSQKDNTIIPPLKDGDFRTFGTFTKDKLEDFFDFLFNELKSFPLPDRVAKTYYLQGIRNRLLHEKGTPNPPCVALKSHIRLFPDGTMPVCQFNSKRVGDLLTQSFEEIRESKVRQNMMKWVDKCSGCWAECEILPSALYTGDILWKSKSS